MPKGLVIHLGFNYTIVYAVIHQNPDVELEYFSEKILILDFGNSLHEVIRFG